MKTKEEIVIDIRLQDNESFRLPMDACCFLIQKYSDQQNKELRERIEKLEVDNQNFNSDDIYKSHEIQRLTKEVEELKANKLRTIPSELTDEQVGKMLPMCWDDKLGLDSFGKKVKKLIESECDNLRQIVRLNQEANRNAYKELTRLRELLIQANEWVPTEVMEGKTFIPYPLKSKISNALNHKP